MSQENVDQARRAYRHFSEVGEFDSEFVSSDCEFDYSNAMPDVPPFSGLDRANAVLHDWTATFDDFRVEADRFLDAGEDRLVVFVRNTGRLKESGAPIENRFVHVWTIRDGKGVRPRSRRALGVGDVAGECRRRAAALRALGRRCFPDSR
jgi:ketosteroid isomerase-like protein